LTRHLTKVPFIATTTYTLETQLFRIGNTSQLTDTDIRLHATGHRVDTPGAAPKMMFNKGGNSNIKIKHGSISEQPCSMAGIMREASPSHFIHPFNLNKKVPMKLNWKLLLASVILLVAVLWMVDSLRTRTYSGTDLNFGIGSGSVTIENTSESPVNVQLVGTGLRSFTVSNRVVELSGSSVREGTGSSSRQVFAFALPIGITEFMVSRGSNVHFMSSSSSNLQATVTPLDEGAARTTMIVSLLVVVGALFFMSQSTGHRLVRTVRRTQPVVATVPSPTGSTEDSSQGRSIRSYGDNRSR
jgi:hypothetical protein